MLAVVGLLCYFAVSAAFSLASVRTVSQRRARVHASSRASEAHQAAARFSDQQPLSISPHHKAKAESIQLWLDTVFNNVDYERALDRADGAPDPFEGEDDDESTTYGEFPLPFLVALLETLDPPPTARFLDLGSGRGQITFAAARSRPWSSCQGLEIVPQLHFIADEAGVAARRLCGVNALSCPVSFYLGDIYSGEATAALLAGGETGESWGGKVLVFVYATCLEVDAGGELVRLAAALAALPVGATVVTVNRPLPVLGGAFKLEGAYRGPNPEASTSETGATSCAFVWSKEQ